MFSFPPILLITAHPGSGPGLGMPREPSQDAVLKESAKMYHLQLPGWPLVWPYVCDPGKNFALHFLHLFPGSGLVLLRELLPVAHLFLYGLMLLSPKHTLEIPGGF